MTSFSIQATLSRWFAVQTLFGLSLACAGVYAATRWSLLVKQDDAFGRHAEFVQHAVRETRDPPDPAALRHKLDDYFTSHAGVTLAVRPPSSAAQPLYASPLPPAEGRWIGRTLALEALPLAEGPVQMRLALEVSGDDLLLRRLAWTLVGAAGLGTLLVSFTGALLVRRGLRPLATLAAQTAAIGPGRSGQRIDAAGYASELQPWIGQFNALLERVGHAYLQLEAFNADVAHELRTPLSNMIAQAEIEMSRGRSAADLQDALGSQLEEARRLAAIVADMLFLSQADRGVQARRAEAASLAEQVAAVAEFHEAALEEAGLSLAIEGDARLPMDVGLVRRAISNLVGNAVRYALAPGTIRVEIRRQGEKVVLSVENRGEGIAPAALPRLFERFYRAEPSRTGSSTHHGLGLSIVGAIARMHGGDTLAECRDGVTRIGFSMADAPAAR